MAKRDVDLVIRARDEASKAFERASAAIESLVNLNGKAGASATGAGSKFEQMATAVLSLDKAMAQVTGKYDAATQGLARQATQISEYNTRLTALKAQMESAGKAADKLRQSIVQTTLEGGDTAPLVAKLQAAQNEMVALGSETRKLERSLSKTQTTYSQNAVALGTVESGLRALGSAATFARAEADKVTRTLEEQERAARQAASVMETVNRTTGVTRDRGDYDQLVAQIREAAAAEDVRIAKLEAEASAINKATSAQREYNALLDAASGKSARASASVFAENGPTDFEKQIAAKEAAEQAAEAERSKAAAADLTNQKLVEQARLQNAIASLDRRTGLKADSTRLAELLREEEAEAKIVEAEQARAAAAEQTNQKLIEQGRLQAALANLDQRSGQKAGETLLAQQLRDEEEAWRKNEAAVKSEAAALATLRSQLDPLAAIEARVAAETEKLNTWYRQGKISAQEYAAALKLVKKSAEDSAARQRFDLKGRPSFLGLTPNELTNLSYQVNDVFTQIASGTSIMQTLAQQGGQIIQIFPKAGAAIASALKSGPVLATVAAIGVLIVAIKDAVSEAEKFRQIQGTLSFGADGAEHSAETLTKAAQALDDYGVSAEDALKAVRLFLKEGVDDSRIEQLGRTAADTATVLGQDMTQAAEDVAKAFTRGYDAIRKLDDSLNFLTDSERDHIKALFDEGRASEARNEALKIYSDKMHEAAQNMRGPWSEAARELKNAWQEFIDLISDSTPFQSMGETLAQLGRDAAAAVRELRGASNADDIARQLQSTRDQIKSVQDQLKSANGFTRGGLEASLKFYKDQETALQKQLDGIHAQNGALSEQGDVLAQNQERTAKATKDLKEATVAAKELKNQTLAEVKADALQKANKYLEENFQFASDAAKAEYRRQEIAEATAKWYEKQSQEAKKLADEREREIQKFNGRVIGAEGGSADNPFSSATGFGQFIDSTWLDQFRKVFREQSETLSRDQILALRQNQTVAKAIIDNYARENAKFLESFGAKVTAGNLYLAHFLGAGDAKKVLTAPGNTPVDQLLSSQVINANKGYLTTNGRARTASELKTFIADRVGDTGTQQSQGQVAIARLESDRLEKQAKFNLAVQQENDERQRNIDALTEQTGLQDTALLAAQKQAAVDKAEADLRDKIARVNENLKPGQDRLELTEQQIQKTRELAAAEFDLQHARQEINARLNEVQRPVDDLAARRDALREQIDTYRELGQNSLADSLVPQLDAVNTQLIQALERLKEFYNGLTDLEKVELGITADGIAAITSQIEIAQQKSFEWINFLGISGQTIAQQFSQGAASAFDRFAQAVANGSNAFKSLWEAFRQFAADFLRQIAQMIIQQLIFNLVAGALGGGVSGGGGAKVTGSTSAFAGVKAHSGGVIGDASTYNGDTGVVRVSPGWFQNAMRYHSGGIAGLKPDEVPAILQRGEEVITRADARHRDNGGINGGQAPNIRIVNTLDPGEFVSKGLGTRNGEQAILNYIRDNSAAVKQALG